MSEHERQAKLEELDSLIASLQDELAETPNIRWQHVGTQFRLTMLIRLTQKRHLLSL